MSSVNEDEEKSGENPHHFVRAKHLERLWAELSQAECPDASPLPLAC
ncbi:MAG: hypothetical protein VKL39_04820 [Leptolyngbyaceae bacterium]|nr:hypothetical protein [Leptolyngbyaceae bacterium]